MKGTILVFLCVCAGAVLAAVPSAPDRELRADGSTRRGWGGTQRVVNGEPVENLAAFPHVVALFIDRVFACTGSLLDDRIVLTAAHCYAGRAQYAVCAGSAVAEEGNCTLVTRFDIHPNYRADDVTDGYDVGILLLENSVSGVIRPVTIAFDKAAEDSKAVAVGYGTINSHDRSSRFTGVLHYVDLLVMPHDYCSFANQGGIFGNRLDRRMLCTTGDHDGSQGGVCHGDSGGPLFQRQSDNSLIQMAVVSIGELVSRGGEPGCQTDDNEQAFNSLHGRSVRRFIEETVDELGGTLQVRELEQKAPATCFPSHATVRLENGETRRMDGLASGDRVLAASGQYSDVIGFTHRDNSPVSKFVQMCAASSCLEASPSHYVYVNGGLRAAGSVRVGDVLTSGAGAQLKVDAVRTVTRRGLYNPQTISGNIVVDGVLASTYTQALHPVVAHSLLWLPRALYRLGVRNALGGVFYRDVPGWVLKLLPRGESVLLPTA
mmetsp:Transcript_127/g.381  ORF Transcript_127/g.381 Transcript_127/m.381 type:complete len:490 (-) Transcript_127:125-1594(-)